jgi:signal transduction histidine kinase
MKALKSYETHILSLLVMGLGLTVMTGWFFKNLSIIQIFPMFPPMYFSTALGFSISGLGLFVGLSNRPQLSRYIGIVLFGMGGLSLIETITGVQVGLNSFLTPPFIKGIFNGAPGPNTSLCFLFTGLIYIFQSILNLKNKWTKLFFYLCSSIIISIGANALLGFALSIETFIGWGSYPRMSLHSAVGFTLLGLGNLYFYINTFHKFDPRQIYQSIGVTVLSIVFSFTFWQVLEAQNTKFMLNIFQNDLKSQVIHLYSNLQNEKESFERMVFRLKNKSYIKDLSSEEFERFYYNLKDVHSIIWVSTDNELIQSFPQNMTSIYNLAMEQDALRESILQKKPSYTKVITFDGDAGFIAYFPIFDKSVYKGAIAVAYNLNDFIVRNIDQSFYRRYGFLISQDGEILFRNAGSKKDIAKHFFSELSFEFSNLNFIIQTFPKNTFLNSYHSYFPLFLLFLGVLVSVSMGLFIFLISSITHAKTKLNAQRKLLEESNRSLMEFAYVASHDLKEPLRSISGFCTILAQKYESLFDKEAQKYFEFITSGCLRMQNLLNDILMFSRVSNQVSFKEEVDLNKVLDQVLENIRESINSSNAKVTIKKLPTIISSETSMIQLYQNLISNALKYSREGVIPEIVVSCKRTEDDYIFSVSDNGKGMDENFLKGNLFVMFKRGHDSNDLTGTGIGLSICKKIVDLHRGEIWATSVIDKGTTFYIKLKI